MMEKDKLQKLLDKDRPSAREMRQIAEAYLRGDVLKDYTAAEAWLHKVIDSGDNEDSMIAMVLLVREILGIDEVISVQDYKAMKTDYENSVGLERKQKGEILRGIDEYIHRK